MARRAGEILHAARACDIDSMYTATESCAYQKVDPLANWFVPTVTFVSPSAHADGFVHVVRARVEERRRGEGVARIATFTEGLPVGASASKPLMRPRKTFSGTKTGAPPRLRDEHGGHLVTGHAVSGV